MHPEVVSSSVPTTRGRNEVAFWIESGLSMSDFDDDDEGDKTSIRPLSDLMGAVQNETPQIPYVLVMSGSLKGKMFKLTPGEMLVGRSPDCDIMLEDDGVSRKHARLVCRQDGRIHLLDLGSTNGTWVEGAKVDLQELQDGDRIQIGSATILKYGLDDSTLENLYDDATRDGLTGVFNKRYFLDTLKREFAWHRRHDHPLALAFSDIDHFKKINDTFGHQAGDYCLKKLSEVAAAVCRSEDIFARYGGEEFAFILRQTTSKDGTTFAERLRGAIENTKFVFNGDDGPVQIPVTISIGVGELTPNVGDEAELIEKADKYLYKAKQNGRNRVESSFFD